ncbi:MAG: hypothetical protein WCF72_05620, partial [Pseudolabrys sp.]
ALDHVQRLVRQEIASDPRHRASPHAITHDIVPAFSAKIHAEPLIHLAARFASYRRILVTDGVRRQRFELAI